MNQIKLKTTAVIVSVIALLVVACGGSATPIPESVLVPSSTESAIGSGGVNINENVVSGVSLQEGATSGTGVNATSAGIAESSASNGSRPDSDGANVVAVSVSGNSGNYSLSVTVESPDIGCHSYADWWEVVSDDGELLTRRVLLHSHVGEQPFTRSGGPLNVQPDDTLIVRAHMSETGYGGSVMRGTVAGGFSIVDISPDFASNLENQSPLPSSCAF
ncbi:MAG: hypothetical protein H8E48_06310 [Chloroflexi bacterium]|nr:hypothetical protein [Chloroflexota bacterium]